MATQDISLVPNTNMGSATLVDGTEFVFDILQNQDCQLFFPTLPEVNFFTQRVMLPTVTVNQIKQPTRYVDTNQVGEKLHFDNFTFSFLVDKKFRNWSSIFNWMKRMTVNGSNVGETDDPVLIVSGIHTLRFVGAWPTSLGGFDVNTVSAVSTNVSTMLTINYDYIDYTGVYTTPDSTYT